MSKPPDVALELAPRLRRMLELAYGVEGVVAARVWHWSGGVAVGVRGGSTTTPADLLKRVERAVSGLREPGETWDFGILDDVQAAGRQDETRGARTHVPPR